MGASVTLVGFVLGETITSFGLLHALRETLQGPEIVLADYAPATVPNLFALSTWLVILPLALVLDVWLVRGAPGPYLGGWDWRRAGLILGLIGVPAWLVGWPTSGGCNIGHGLTGVPTLALSSLTATTFTLLGAWVGNHVRFARPCRVESCCVGTTRADSA